MNEPCKYCHSQRLQLSLVAWMILAALLVLLPAAGCEKKGANTPPPQATTAETMTKPTPATQPLDPPPQETAKGEPRAADDTVLPSAQQIFDRYIEVTGGREAYEKLRNVEVQGTNTVTRSGLSMDYTAYKAAPNKHLQVTEPEDRGVSRRGCDGETVWLLSENKDPFILEGAPRDALMRQQTFLSLLHLADLYEYVETVGIEELGDVDCYHVRLTPPRGFTESNFYSIESGLLVMRRVLVRVAASYGDVPRETTLSDYQETSGIRSPRNLRKTQTGQEVVVTINRVEYNIDLADDFFDLPDEVQAALDEALAGSSEQPTTDP